MRVTELSLRNFKCYADASVSFDRGVTVIHGVNGSGKSSLLDAAFFALYGSDALVGTLDEVISTGEEETELMLSFSHAGRSYSLTRRVRMSGERAQTATCEFETPAETLSGARAVRDEIVSLLRMDAEAFLNCAYVRQGEVNKLIHAAPRERQDMIDELLQLGVLETYRDRAIEARRGIASLRDEYGGQLEATEDRLAEKRDANPTEELNELETRRDELEEHLDELDTQMEEAEATRSEAEDVLERLSERREEVDALTEEISSLEETIAETTRERERRRDRIGTLSAELASVRDRIDAARRALPETPEDRAGVRDRREALADRDETLREEIEAVRLEIQRHEQTATEAEATAEERRDRAAELAEDVAQRRETIDREERELAERRERLTELRDDREARSAELADAGHESAADIASALEEEREARSSLRERESELHARREQLADDVEEMETLIDAGKCPMCGQPTEEAPAVDALAADREELETLRTELDRVRADRESHDEAIERLEDLAETADERDRLSDRIDSTSSLVDEQAERLEERRAECETLADERDSVREAATEADERAADERTTASERRERIAEINEERATVRERREAVESVLELHELADELDDDIGRERERREHLVALDEERQGRLAEKRDRRNTLQHEIDEERVAEARDSLERAEAYLEEATEEYERIDDERDEVIDRIGGVQRTLQELRELRERRDELAAARDAIDHAHDDVTTLESLYGELRTDLREQNLVALERMLNETFDLVYRNDAYDRIELDRDYRMTVHQKDGSALDPSLLSGGERALFNLSLRCAIYRLLSEGIEGTAPLPPLILDEPTVYLDAGHVGRLVDLVDAMRSIGVEQIVLVTHDDELLRAADAVLAVEKDPTSNRSSVSAEPVTAGLPQS